MGILGGLPKSTEHSGAGPARPENMMFQLQHERSKLYGQKLLCKRVIQASCGILVYGPIVLGFLEP